MQAINMVSHVHVRAYVYECEYVSAYQQYVHVYVCMHGFVNARKDGRMYVSMYAWTSVQGH